MPLTIDLAPEDELAFRVEAGLKGQTPEELVQSLVEAHLEEARAQQIVRNQAALALLRQWREEPPCPEEAEGYPFQITPLSLREVQIESSADCT